MSDGEKKEVSELEQYGDSQSPAAIAEDMANMSDLALGKIAGVASVLKDHDCGGAREASNETDGTCRVYNAALAEFDHRSKNETQR